MITPRSFWCWVRAINEHGLVVTLTEANESVIKHIHKLNHDFFLFNFVYHFGLLLNITKKKRSTKSLPYFIRKKNHEKEKSKTIKRCASRFLSSRFQNYLWSNIWMYDDANSNENHDSETNVYIKHLSNGYIGVEKLPGTYHKKYIQMLIENTHNLTAMRDSWCLVPSIYPCSSCIT